MSRPPDAPDGAARAGQAATIAGLALLALYATTAARHVTWWDAGEFAAAFGALGVPHPPGTPLFVLLGRVWTAGLAPFGVTLAHAGALLAAACTAATGALVAWALARATGSRAAGIAAALCAGGMSTVWGSATEVEVYATATLLAACAVAAGHRAGLALDAAARARWDALVAYLFALAVPLHLSALVAAPAVAWLAASAGSVPPNAGDATARVGAWRTLDGRRLVLHLALAAAAAGAGSGRVWLAGAGLALATLLATLRRVGVPRAALHVPARLVIAFALGLAPLLAMLVRARHDPAVNQGNPATWQALADVVARRQYAPAGLWPRQAPWWLQVGNLFEWADWQVAFGLSQTPGPSVARTALTLAFVALGVVGAAWHRRRDPRTFRAAALLLLGGTLGVAAWLNLKAGPSYGWGVLPDGAPREARERDYFLILGFWVWGAWAGAGAVAVARAVVRRLARAGATSARLAAACGVALAALPIAANWRVADRRLGADARTPEAYGATLLASVPPNGVLVTGGDNDSYPLWHAQVVLGFRPDVAIVTTSLLPAPWYRAELARRHRLLAPAFVGPWRGEPATLAAITDGAIAEGRALVVGLGVGRATRASLAGTDGAGPWVLHGAARLLARTAVPRQGMAGVLRGMPAAGAHAGHGAAAAGGGHGGHGMHVEPERPPSLVDAPAALRDPDRAGVARVDTLVAFSAIEALAQRWPALLDASPRAGSDGVTAWALAQLRCPGAALDAVRAAPRAATTPGAAPAVRLEATCNRR